MFYLVNVLSNQAWEAASQTAPRDCSKEERKEPGKPLRLLFTPQYPQENEESVTREGKTGAPIRSSADIKTKLSIQATAPG